MDEQTQTRLNVRKPAKQRDSTEHELRQAVREAHDILATATTVFPFTLFPDTITIDREKVTVTQRLFFKVAEVVTIRIEDALNVTADVGPFMGSLKISTRFFDPEKPYTVNYLTRKDALKMKRILGGYIIAMQKDIDCSALDTNELAALLDELGQASPNNDV